MDEERKCAVNVNDPMLNAKGSFIDVLKTLLGKDISEVTQYAIDFVLFGLASEDYLF